MSADQSQQVAQVYSWLRAMSGGKLSQSQVMAGDQIIEKNGLNVFLLSDLKKFAYILIIFKVL